MRPRKKIERRDSVGAVFRDIAELSYDELLEFVETITEFIVLNEDTSTKDLADGISDAAIDYLVSDKEESQKDLKV